MGRWKRKKLEWRKRNCKKISLERKRKRKNSRASSYNSIRGNTPRNIEVFQASAPKIFSVSKSPDIVYKYFSDIIKEIKLKKFKEIFFFDLTDVEELTVDAIMYMLAIIRNIKGRKTFKYTFKGNQPKSQKANILLMESGFFRYVKSNNPFLHTDSENKQITTGKIVDGNIAGDICDFVNKKCNTKLYFTDELYELIIELMANTVQHAYNDKGVLTVNHWYIYAGEIENKIQLVFLDTGRGIPQTVYKKATERFGELFTNNKTDSYYVVSALNGEWRSQTAESYRGRGLPCVAEYTKRKEVHNFTITSGKAVVKMGHLGVSNNYDLNNLLFGTLYYWEILKDSIKEEYHIG